MSSDYKYDEYNIEQKNHIYNQIQLKTQSSLTLYFLGKLHSGLKRLNFYYRQRGFSVFNVAEPDDLEQALSASSPHILILDLQTCQDVTRFFDVLSNYDGLLDLPRIAIISATTNKEDVHLIMDQADASVSYPFKAKDLSLYIFTLLLKRVHFIPFDADSWSEEGFHSKGTLYPFFLNNIIQLAYLGRKDCVVYIETIDGQRGALYIQEGILVDAHIGTMDWEPALLFLKQQTQGTFYLSFQHIDRKPVITKDISLWLGEIDGTLQGISAIEKEIEQDSTDSSLNSINAIDNSFNKNNRITRLPNGNNYRNEETNWDESGTHSQIEAPLHLPQEYEPENIAKSLLQTTNQENLYHHGKQEDDNQYNANEKTSTKDINFGLIAIVSIVLIACFALLYWSTHRDHIPTHEIATNNSVQNTENTANATPEKPRVKEIVTIQAPNSKTKITATSNSDDKNDSIKPEINKENDLLSDLQKEPSQIQATETPTETNNTNNANEASSTNKNEVTKTPQPEVAPKNEIKLEPKIEPTVEPKIEPKQNEKPIISTDTIEPPPVQLAELHINAYPYGIVYVDGEKHGYTPVHITKVVPRKYSIRVVNPDVGTCNTEVSVKPGERKWVHLRLDDIEKCQNARNSP